MSASVPLIAPGTRTSTDGDPEASALEYDLVLVHPAEGVAPKGAGAALMEILCGCEVKGSKESPEVLSRRRALHARMRCIGLTLAFDLSRDGDETLVKVRAPEAMLEQMAERLAIEKKVRVPACKLAHCTLTHCLSRPLSPRPRAAHHDTKFARCMQLLSDGYADFSAKHKHLFAPNTEPSSSGPGASFFTSLERIRLLVALLEAPKPDGGCGLELDREVASGILTAVVPMHDRRVTEGTRYSSSPPLLSPPRHLPFLLLSTSPSSLLTCSDLLSQVSCARGASRRGHPLRCCARPPSRSTRSATTTARSSRCTLPSPAT